MDAIERAIRNAFEKGDPDDRAFRERVYRSAHAALERAIRNNPAIDEAGAEQRRALFRRRVVEVEQEFVPAVEVPDSPPRPDADPIPSLQVDTAPGPRAPADMPDSRLDLSPSDMRAGTQRPDAAEADIALDRRDRLDQRMWSRERRRPFALMFILITLLAAGLIGGWWAADVLMGRKDGSVPNPPLVLEEEEFQPQETTAPRPPLVPGAPQERDWIVIFDPADPTRLQAPAGTTAEVVEREGLELLRVSSSAEGAVVSFDIGEGVLEQLAGRTAVFSVDAAGEEGGEMQISVSCDFGALGDCGRRRYLVGYERGEYLFEVDLPDEEPSGPGAISINPGVSGNGRTLDIYAIKVVPQS